MEKFSSYSQNFNKPQDDNNYLWKGNYMKVKEIDGFETVIETDYVIILPYLIDYDEFLLRKEVIPPFTFREGNEFYLTVISGSVEKNEDLEKTLFRELEEEAGIRLNAGFKGYIKWNELFLNKGSVGKYHIYYLPLYNYDYKMVPAKGDGSETEKKSSTVKIDVKYLNNLNTSDMITTLTLEYFKKEINKY